MQMKSFKFTRHFLYCQSKPISSSSLLQQSCSYASESSSSPSEPPKPAESKVALTQQELYKINLLIPRLCLSDQLTTAIHLITTSLLTSPCPQSLPLPILIHSLTSQTDMTKPMSLLTILRHTPQAHPYLMPITTLLITSYMKKKRPKEALKVYHWMLRAGSPCQVEKAVYGVLVRGFCGFELVLEALRVLRDMVHVGLLPGAGLRRRVYRSLLREARVREALEFDKVFCASFEDANGENTKKAIELLDSMIGNWTE